MTSLIVQKRKCNGVILFYSDSWLDFDDSGADTWTNRSKSEGNRLKRYHRKQIRFVRGCIFGCLIGSFCSLATILVPSDASPEYVTKRVYWPDSEKDIK